MDDAEDGLREISEAAADHDVLRRPGEADERDVSGIDRAGMSPVAPSCEPGTLARYGPVTRKEANRAVSIDPDSPLAQQFRWTAATLPGGSLVGVLPLRSGTPGILAVPTVAAARLPMEPLSMSSRALRLG